MKLKNIFLLGLFTLTISACSNSTPETSISPTDQVSETPSTDSTLPVDWKTEQNEKYGFEFKDPNSWLTAEACLNFEKECDGTLYKFGILSGEELGTYITGLQIHVLPTTDKQKVSDFAKNKIFDGKWFSFQKEDTDGQTYLFNGTSEFQVKFIWNKDKTYILSPVLDSIDATLNEPIFDQVVSGFKINP